MAQSHSSELRSCRRDLAESRQKLSRVEEDLEAKLSSSTQFQQMRKLITDKTDQVKDLRKRLTKYEPDIDADERVRR